MVFIEWFVLFRNKLNITMWKMSDAEEQYNWSNDYRSDYINDFNYCQDPLNKTLQKHSFTSNTSVQHKPEVATEDGMDPFGVLFDEFEPSEQSLEIPCPPPLAAPLPPAPKQQAPLSSNIIHHSPISEIQISKENIYARFRFDKGDKFQTKNIGKHIHSETYKFLKNLAAIRLLNNDQKILVKIFADSGANIDSFKDLLKNGRICAFVRDYFSSAYFIREVMASKMEMRTKITIIRYLEKIRSVTYDRDFKGWKKDPNDLE